MVLGIPVGCFAVAYWFAVIEPVYIGTFMVGTLLLLKIPPKSQIPICRGEESFIPRHKLFIIRLRTKLHRIHIASFG